MAFFRIILLSLLLCISVYAQSNDSLKINKALEYLNLEQLHKAVALLKNISDKRYVSRSYHLQAQIYLKKGTADDLDSANISIKKALALDPDNIEYLLTHALIKESSFAKIRDAFFDREEAVSIYGRILTLQPDNAAALFNLGKIKSAEYLEYAISAMKFDSNKVLTPSSKMFALKKSGTLKSEKLNEFNNTPGNYAALNFENYAGEEFAEAEALLTKSLQYSKYSNMAVEELLKIYFQHKQYDRGLALSDKIIEDSSSVNCHLLEGLIYNTLKNYKTAYSEFFKAMKFMPAEDKDDMNLYSAIMLVGNENGKNSKNKVGIERSVAYFWDISDPLLLTGYNERMLEHYARFTYANMFLSPVRIKRKGWKTSRGETVIRYGLPVRIERLRRNPELSPGPETELWYYADKIFSFSDPDLSGTFSFSVDYNSQVPMNTHEEMITLRETKPQEYIPEFEGPVVDLNNSVFQFSSQKGKTTDIYLSFGAASAERAELFDGGYEAALFVMNNDFQKLIQRREKVNKVDSSRVKILNSFSVELAPQDGSIALELIRNKDKGVASYHGKYSVRNFSHDSLAISSIVPALDVKSDEEFKSGFKRGEYSILPNPACSITQKENLYLYYEIYNLSLGKDKLTNFEQQLAIKKTGDETVFNRMLEIVGLGRKGEKLTMQSDYQTLEINPKIYFQLDMSSYPAGDYEITISVKDRLTMKTVSDKVNISRKE